MKHVRRTVILAVCGVVTLVGRATQAIPDERTLISSLESLQWTELAPGVWRARLGPKQWAPLDLAFPPKRTALDEMGPAEFPFAAADCRAKIEGGRTHFRLPLTAGERLYGLGLEFRGANRRGQVFQLKVDHYGGIKGHTHAPVPFYISSAGYGVLINTARRPTIHAGISNRKDSELPPRVDRTTHPKEWKAYPLSDAVEGSVPGEGVEILVFGGRTPLEAVRRYNLYCGGGALPPRWALGFWHRLHTRSSADDVRREIAAFRKHDFPLDVVGLEPGWQTTAYPCSFDWSEERFPQPEAFVRELAAEGLRVNLWENPYVSPRSSAYAALRPYTGSHTVWLGEVPDYSLPEARRILLDHHERHHLRIGVSGYKFDEVDGYDAWLWPDHATFPSGHDGESMRQMYGLMLQRMFMDRFRGMNRRTFGLVRGSNAGASAFGFALYSDHYDHAGYVTAIGNASLAGILWTPEIRSAKTDEEWVRRFQTVALSPILQLNAWASGAKPWSFPEVTEHVRAAARLRSALTPYIYTAYADYTERGVPPFRSMILESGFETPERTTGGELDDVTNPYAHVRRLEKTDQYMIGPSLLVAPMLAGQTSREVILPAGDWFDFHTGRHVGSGGSITVSPGLDQIPLFVKDGGIVPMMAPVNTLARQDGAVAIEVRHYGNKPGEYLLYDDDGESFDYERGESSRIRLRVAIEDGRKQGSAEEQADGWRSRYRDFTWRYMTSGPNP